jgi:glucans biosynthesis protein
MPPELASTQPWRPRRLLAAARVVASGLAALGLTAPALAQSASPFTLEALRQRARELSKQSYTAREAPDLPEWLAKLDHDGYRRIVFRPSAALWSGEGLPFQVRFAHRGYLYGHRVPIHVIAEDGAVAEAMFSPAQFEYHLDPSRETPATLGYAGLAILSPVAGTETWREVGSFLGAAFFRIVGTGQRYGASARGLAVDTASPKGEEFPEFAEMWVRRPAPDAASLELFARLDSPSATGAFQFVLTPGENTRIDVHAWLYPRRKIEKLGLAPLTSMFLHGEDRLRCVVDFRPEVHDSDGLSIATDNGWIWRPLINPERQHRVSRLQLDDPRGFGLLQRDREFANYQDLETRSELRPSYWVTPRGPWGKGALELVEIPSDGEHNDNIVAYWTPDRSPAAGDEFAFSYTLSARMDEPELPPLARVLATRVRPSGAAVLFVLDFEGVETDGDSEKLVASVRASSAELRHVVLRTNDAVGGARLAFELVGADDKPVELHAFLKRGEQPVSETWWFQWPPK